jgi:lysophospholipase L1-like esterase
MKKVRVLFQGDSITDAGRDKRNFRDMGKGYPKYAAEQMIKDHPEVEFDFINLGISGNRTDQLFDRLYNDAVALEPDVISILIGINDVWHRYGSSRVETTDEQIALNYRSILKRLRAQTNAKIVMIAPYLLDCEDKEPIREDLKTVLPIIRELAKEFADVYIPLDELFEEALKTQPEPRYYSGDAVHPNTNGAMFIGGKYAEAVKALIESL